MALAGIFLPVIVGSIVAILSFLAAAVATAGFVVLIVTYFILKRHFNHGGNSFKFGTAFWLDVAAAIALFVASLFFGIGICCNVCGGRRKERQQDDATMYNRLFAEQQEPEHPAEERINMEHMDTTHHAENETPKFVPYGHSKTGSVDTGAGSTAANLYYPPNQEVYEERPGDSSVALVPAPVQQTTYATVPATGDNGVRSGAPVLGPEREMAPEWYNGQRGSTALSSQLHSLEGSEYEDAATAPSSEHFVDARVGTPAYAPGRTTATTTTTTNALPYMGTTTTAAPTMRSAAPHVGAYDPEPALPSNLRGGSVPQELNDSWFLPGSSSQANELPGYQGGRPGVYPQEKRGVL